MSRIKGVNLSTPATRQNEQQLRQLQHEQQLDKLEHQQKLNQIQEQLNKLQCKLN